MPRFNRRDGQFIAYAGRDLRFDERRFFANANWHYEKSREAWVTTNYADALELRQFAVGAAKEYIENTEMIRAESIAGSHAEDYGGEFPCPEGEAYLPFQKAGIAYALDGADTLIADPPGLGKESPVDTKVITPTGWRRMGDLVVGDFVIGSQGTPVKVTGVFPQGVKPSYRVTFRDGASVECGREHLWTVTSRLRTRFNKPPVTKTLAELDDAGLVGKDGKAKWRIPLVEPVRFTPKEYILSPYTMGVLLGDGSLHGSSPQLTVGHGEEEILDRIAPTLPAGYTLNGRPKPSAGCTQYLLARKGRRWGNSPSIIKKELSRLNLQVHGKYKHIPEEYLLGSAEQRLDLLRGLMDSDGSCRKNRSTFHNKTLRLVEDVQQLVWSLGGTAILRTYDWGDKGVEYHLNVKMFVCPFYLRRKAARWSLPKSRAHRPSRYMRSAEYVGDKEQVCISVDAEDGLYVTEDYIVTHNTVQAIGVHNAREAKSILVVCTASLKINWSREWRKWDIHGKTVGIAGSKARSKTEDGFTRTWTEHIWPDTDVVIINYDMLETFDEQLKAKEWDLFIADECHHLKGMQTVRTKCVFGGRKKARKNASGKVIKSHVDFLPIRAKTRLFLTGTPILSRPAELWVLLRACDPDGLGRDYDAFVTEFCAAEQGPFKLDVSGAQNEEKLQELLRSRFMVRRDKRSVLKELPDKLREIVTLPHDKLKKPIRKEKSRIETALSAYEAVLGLDSAHDEFWYLSVVDKLGDKLEEALDAQDPDNLDWEAAVQQLSEPDKILFTEISAAREEIALAKVGMVVEHVAKLVDAEEPVILFAYHKSVIAELREQLEKMGLRVGVITGATPSNKRQGVVDQFQDGELDVILGNIIAMGEGYTITRARFVVFAELDWVPAKIEQAEDRAWRIGQANAVLVQHLVVDGSIEARMVIALLEKMLVIAQVLDAKKG
jgi:hypothetical protein